MERTLIAPGVHLSCDPAEKFNRCRISIHFAFPAQRATATAHALLPLVLERGYADCPDMTLLTKKLAKLYGADLTVDARPMGCNHNLCVSVTGIKDRFALEGEPLTREYASIALGAAFHPAFVGGVFDPQAVEIEKQMLKKALEDEVNDKRIYCLRQANREFFGDSRRAAGGLSGRGGWPDPGAADRGLPRNAAHRQHRAHRAGLRRCPDGGHPGCAAGRADRHRPGTAAAGGKYGHPPAGAGAQDRDL